MSSLSGLIARNHGSKKEETPEEKALRLAAYGAASGRLREQEEAEERNAQNLRLAAYGAATGRNPTGALPSERETAEGYVSWYDRLGNLARDAEAAQGKGWQAPEDYASTWGGVKQSAGELAQEAGQYKGWWAGKAGTEGMSPEDLYNAITGLESGQRWLGNLGQSIDQQGEYYGQFGSAKEMREEEYKNSPEYLSQEHGKVLENQLQAAEDALSWSNYKKGPDEAARAAKERLEEWRGRVDLNRANRYIEDVAEPALAGLDEETIRQLDAINGRGISLNPEVDEAAEARRSLLEKGYSNEDIARLSEYRQRVTDREDTEARINRWQDYAGTNFGTGVLSSAASVLAAPLSGVGNLEALRGVLPSWLGGYAENGAPVNVYSGAFAPNYMRSTIRSEISKNINNDTLSWLYGAGMSAADNAAIMLTGGALAKAAGAAAGLGEAAVQKLTGQLVAGMMSLNVSADTILDEIDKGYSNDQAIGIAVARGIFEYLGEKWSIERILKNPAVWYKRLPQSGLTEGSEEVVTNWMNRALDGLIGHKTDVQERYEQIMAGGEKNKALALARALVEVDVEAFGAGALAGMFMGGVRDIGPTAGAIRTGRAYSTGETVTELTTADGETITVPPVDAGTAGLIESGLESPEGSESRELAETLLEKAKAGKTISAEETGRLAQANEAQIRAEDEGALREAMAQAEEAETVEDAAARPEPEKPQQSGFTAAERRMYQDMTRTANREGPVMTDTDRAAERVAERINEAESARTSLDRAAESSGLGENGRAYLRSLYTGGDTGSYFGGFLAYYNAGMANESADAVSTRRGETLTPEQRQAAWNAGRMDAVWSVRDNGKAVVAKKPGYVRDAMAKRANPTAREERYLDVLGRATGTTIRFGELDGDTNAEYDPKTATITVNVKAKDPVIAAATHEIVHRVRDMDPQAYRALRDFVVQNMSDERLQRASALRSRLYETGDVSYYTEELVADAFGRMAQDQSILEDFVRENRTAAQRFLDAIRDVIDRVKRILGRGGESRQLTGAQQAEFEDLLDRLTLAQAALEEALGERTAETETLGTVPGDAVGELRASRRYDNQYMDKAEAVNKKTGFVSAAEMEKARADRANVAAMLKAVEDFLPADIEGNTWISNSSYGGSQENNTVCVRSLAYDELMDAVARKLGRPLTVSDTVFVAQEAMALTDKPECLYCYVAMDRKAYREFLLEYIKQRDAFLKDVHDGMEIGIVEPMKKAQAKAAGASRKIGTDTAFGRYLHGRDNTANTADRAKLWLEADKAGTLISSAQLATLEDMNEAALDERYRAQIDDAAAYAQAASWGKPRSGYIAYNNGILKWGKNRIANLNRMYGMRMYSFSDYSPAHLLENMQMITDAAVKGLKVLAYTKELDLARIFAPTGANINISVFGYLGRNGQVGMDAMQGADWAQAQELRKQYPNVGITFVATNDKIMDWALRQDWIDVVIPFHMVRTGSAVAKMFGWKNYTEMTEDKKNSGWKEGMAASIMPSQHQNDKETYLRLCRENHLTPRFADWVNHPGYMKLVNETRQSEGQTQIVRPIFDIRTAQASIDEMVKRGGYIQHIGGTREGMLDVADEIADDLMAGATPQAAEGVRKSRVASDEEELAPTFYSKLENEIASFKGDKMGAASVVSYLRGHGVKEEEIKWTGIRQFLDGKKSVTKQELLDFVRANQLKISTEALQGNIVDGLYLPPEYQERFDELEARQEELVTQVDALWRTAFDRYLSADLWDDPGSLKWRIEEAEEEEEHLKRYYPGDPGNEEITPEQREARDELRSIAEELLDTAVELNDLREYRAESQTRWDEYRLDGGQNYREYLFKLPGIRYSNNAMGVHWGSRAEGVLAHARVQDFESDGKPVLFVEEIQSDWHNEGAKRGYVGKGEQAPTAQDKRVPDAPFAKTYHEFVLKSLLRKAAEGGYDYLAWTPGWMQEERWSDEFAEGYRIEYDQDIPKFLRKYGRQWGADMAEISLDGVDNVTVPAIEVNEAMKESLLYEGQPRFSRVASDEEYLAAVERGDMEAAQRMVDEAAKAAGYTIKAYHGTAENFNVFSRGKQGENYSGYLEFGAGFYFTPSEQEATEWASFGSKGRPGRTKPKVMSVCLAPGRILEADSPVPGGAEHLQNLGLTPWESESISNRAYRYINYLIEDKGYSNTEAQEDLKALGFDAIDATSRNGTAGQYVVFDPEQIKSADPVTYDDEGNVIPLSERFNPAEEDIRRSRSGRDDLDEFIRTYGQIPTGENPFRDVPTPVKTGGGAKLSQTVRTVLEAKVTPDEMVPTIERLTADGTYSYTPYSDRAAIAAAEDTIRTKGWATAYAEWLADVKKGIVSKTNTAVGWALYNNAASSGDTEAALEVLDAIVRHQRSAAQAVQATRILKKLSPETQLYQVAKSVQRLQEEINQRYGEKGGPELKVDPKLGEQFMQAATDAQRDKILREIYRDIGRQMPTHFIDRWNAWRYLAMLGNPRTHARNILGNAGFAPVVAIKDLTATGIEAIVDRVSGGKLNRTKGNLLGRGGAELLQAAWADFANVREEVSGEGKYTDANGINERKEIREGHRIFGNTRSDKWNKTGGRALEAARRGNSKLLDVEDAWFSQPHYALALAQFCKANKITPDMIRKGQGLAAARAYAIKEAQKATYRDTNQFSEAISRLGRGSGWDSNRVTRGLSTAIEGILPFRKTPANILVRGMEYSPLGLLKSLTWDIRQVKAGNMSGAELIDHISAGLTGTGLTLLGVLLASMSLVRGHGGDDDKKRKQDELMGHQNYALELPDGTSITLDWLAPECLPFFIGVNLFEQSLEKKDGLKLADILTAVGNVTEPLLEMSCLQSLNAVFDTVGYAKEGDVNALTAALASAATSYLTQALPTLAGQAERSFGEDKRYTTYTEKDNVLTGDMQYTLGKVSGKVPGWEYNQVPYIDAWGREEMTGGFLARSFNNFINPSYTSKVDESAMEKELLRLYESTGESVLPQRAPKYFNVDGVRKDLTGEEYVTYATARGQTAYTVVGRLVSSAGYKSMDDAARSDAVQMAYTYADQTAMTTVGGKISTSAKWVQEALDGKKLGIQPEQYILAYETAVKGITKGLTGPDGKTIENSRGLLRMEAVYKIRGLTDEQRVFLFEAFDVGKSIIGWNQAKVDEELTKMRKQGK